MSFELLCATTIALFVGLAVCFGGYRWFMILLPIWGFFFGFVLGAETVQALLGLGFLATVSGWVVGFITGAIFAVVSYLFYMFAVLMVAGSLGYGLGVGLMGLLGFDFGLIAWLVGVGLAIVLIAATLYWNLAKYVIIGATGIGGAALIVGTLVYGVDNVALARMLDNPIRVALEGSFWWTLLFLFLAGSGIMLQVLMSRQVLIEPYPNRV